MGKKKVLRCPQSCKLHPAIPGCERDREIWGKGCFSWEEALTGFPWVISKASSNTSPQLSGARTPRERNIPCTRVFHFSFGDGLLCALSRWAATYLTYPVATPRLVEGLLMGHRTFEHSPDSGWDGLQRGLELDKGHPVAHPGSWWA